MIGNCRGCESMLDRAFNDCLENGFHVATGGYGYNFVGEKGHLLLCLVDDNGNMKLW